MLKLFYKCIDIVMVNEKNIGRQRDISVNLIL